MKNPSHLEMAGWGLLNLLLVAIFVRITGETFGGIFLFLLLPLAGARAAGTFDKIFAHYAILFFACIAVLILMTIVLRISKYHQPLTLEYLPLLCTSERFGATLRLSVVIFGAIQSIVCATALRMSLARGNIPYAILRAALVYCVLLGFHFAIVKNKPTWEEAYRREQEMLFRSVIGIFTLMPVYAGYYVALFYDLVKETNQKDGVPKTSLNNPHPRDLTDN